MEPQPCQKTMQKELIHIYWKWQPTALMKIFIFHEKSVPTICIQIIHGTDVSLLLLTTSNPISIHQKAGCREHNLAWPISFAYDLQSGWHPTRLASWWYNSMTDRSTLLVSLQRSNPFLCTEGQQCSDFAVSLVHNLNKQLTKQQIEIRGAFQNAYKLWNLRALKFSPANKVCICKGTSVIAQKISYLYTERYNIYTMLKF